MTRRKPETIASLAGMRAHLTGVMNAQKGHETVFFTRKFARRVADALDQLGSALIREDYAAPKLPRTPEERSAAALEKIVEVLGDLAVIAVSRKERA